MAGASCGRARRIVVRGSAGGGLPECRLRLVVAVLLAGLNHYRVPPDRLASRTLGNPQLGESGGLLLGQRLPLDDLLRVREQLTALRSELIGVGEQLAPGLVEGTLEGDQVIGDGESVRHAAIVEASSDRMTSAPAEIMRSPVSEWTVHGSRTIYSSRWVSLDLVDVEPPGHSRYEHHLIRWAPVAATVVLNGRHEVLMMWRHRFATDTWNWEIPSGIVEPGEELEAAAAREVEEETGWRVTSVEPLAYNQPVGGMSNAEHHVFLARSAHFIAPPVDTHEADRIEWIPLGRVQDMIDRREIVAGVAVTGLLQLLARRP